MPDLPHYKMLDGLRGLAAQPVLLSHSFALMFVGSERLGVTTLGWLARLSVILFFVLSGFVISTTITGEIRQTKAFNWVEYGIRRVARIYPPYLAAILLVALFMGLIGVKERTLNTGMWAWLRAASFLFTGTDSITITPVWSLRLEVGLYVFAAMAAAIALTGGWIRGLLIAVTATLLAVFCWKLAFAELGVALFAAGALASIFFHRLVKIRPVWVLAFVALALALPLAWPSLVDDSTVSMAYQDLLGIPLALGLVALAHVKARGSSPLGRLVLASGGWSYTLYIIHIPIVMALVGVVRIGGGTGARVAMVTACLVTANLGAIAVASVVERPKFFAKLIRRVLLRGEASAGKAVPVAAALKNSSSSS